MIHKIGGNVKLTKVITMAPRQAIKTMGLTQIPVPSKRVNVATEAIDNPQDGQVELLPSYESVKRVAVVLYNNTHEKVTLKKGTIVAKVATANVIPPMLAPASGMLPNIPDFGNECEHGYVPSNGRDVPA